MIVILLLAKQTHLFSSHFVDFYFRILQSHRDAPFLHEIYCWMSTPILKSLTDLAELTTCNSRWKIYQVTMEVFSWIGRFLLLFLLKKCTIMQNLIKADERINKCLHWTNAGYLVIVICLCMFTISFKQLLMVGEVWQTILELIGILFMYN